MVVPCYLVREGRNIKLRILYSPPRPPPLHTAFGDPDAGDEEEFEIVSAWYTDTRDPVQANTVADGEWDELKEQCRNYWPY